LSCRRRERILQAILEKVASVRSSRWELDPGADNVTRFTLKEIDQMATGTVKFFNTQKGFGFITPSDGSRDVFVHISAVERAGMSTLHEGQRVSYDVVTERGKQAAGNLQSA